MNNLAEIVFRTLLSLALIYPIDMAYQNYHVSKKVLTIPHTGAVHRGTLILLHGSGDSGPNFWQWVKTLVPDFPFRHIKIIVPTAPNQPYTPNGGAISNVWFDREVVARTSPDILDSIDHTAKELVDIINKEVAAGIPLDKMVIGGFSMGGGMAMQLAFRHLPSVAGVFALSAFLSDHSEIYKLSAEKQRLPPLYMWTGSRDPLVPLSLGNQTFESLQKIGVRGSFHIGQNALHELTRDCLLDVKKWIEEKVPIPNQRI